MCYCCFLVISILVFLSDIWLFCNPMNSRLLYPWDFSGKNTGVGCHSLLQGIFLTQGSNLHLLLYRKILYHWATREAQMQMVIIKKTINNKYGQGCAEKGTLVQCWWACKLVQPLWKAVGRFLKKSKTELSYDPAILLLGIYPSKPKH